MTILSQTSMFLTCLCLTLAPILCAQTTIPNGNFENWQNVGSATEEPTNWNGNKTGGGLASLGPQTCFQEASNVFAGSFSVKLETINFIGNPINATITTGKIEAPNSNPLNGYVHTVTSDADFNSAFTGRPDSLVGWYKYTSVSSDYGRIQALLHDNYDVEVPDQGSSASHIIGEAVFNTPASSVGTWTRFSVPFTYNNSTTPSYILSIATSGAVAGSANIGSTLWLDNLEAIYNTSTSKTLVNNSFDSKVSLFPNPTQGSAVLDLGASYVGVEVSVTDIAGRLVYSRTYSEGQRFDLDLKKPAGVYIVTVSSETKHAVIKLIKQ